MWQHAMSQDIKADRQIGGNIRRYRKARGLTQEQLSAQLQLMGCDISRGTPVKIASGIRHISVAELGATKSILDVSYDALFKE